MTRLLLLACFSLTCMANAAYNPLGIYMSCVDQAPEPLTALPETITRTQGLQTDDAGIPKVMFGGALQYYPANIAGVGLQDWAEYVRFKNVGRLGEAVQLADWLVNWQNKETGVFEHKFKYQPAAGVAVLPEGWANAQAQGMAMSFLARMGTLVGGERGKRYLDAATLALQPFYVESGRGGVRARLNKDIWYEAFPTTPSMYQLPGFLYALVGLNDLALLTGNKQAKTLYSLGLESLKKNIQLFDSADKRILSHLVHVSVPAQQPVFATPGTKGSVGVTTRLLKQITCLSPDAELTRWVRRWERYVVRDDQNSGQK